MIKKLFRGTLLGLLAFWVICLYFVYSGNPNVLRDWIQLHQLYTAIFFVSLVIIYALQWSNKILRFLMFIVILINLFILWDVFFRNNIGLNSWQFLVLFWLLVLGLAVTYITHRIRYVGMVIIGLGIGFVLLMGILPLYAAMPNINDFIQSQKTKIINQGANIEWIVTIKNALGSKQVPLNEIKENDIDLSQKTQISFASKKPSETEKVFIDLWNGSFIHINPQSAITLEQSWSTTIMQIIQWNIQYYTPPELSGAITLIGKFKGESIKDIKNTIRTSLTNEFEQRKEDFFINELGGSMVLNPTVDKIIKFFITTLHSISPKTYQDNLTNYTIIQQYLGKSMTGDISSTTTWENLRSIINDIMFQAKKWAEQTKINQRLQQ